MTDREKQIVEELANDIYSLKSCDTSFEVDCKLLAYELVVTLGWGKIPKEAVVLTKEELEKERELNRKIDLDFAISQFNVQVKSAIEKSIKETAKEIYYKAKNKAYYKDGGYYDKDRYLLDMEDLKEILKELGVEIKE